jgi:beta-aspartyl-peptidase (threonine type)
LPRLAELVREHPEVFQLETVGAVAMDARANVAAATSTGGFPLKLPGRIGDSPSIGCGTYADNQSGACSATGVGEIAIRLVLAKNVCSSMESGETAQQAVEEAMRLVGKRLPGIYNEMGLLAVDVHGRIGAAHSSPNLCWAYMSEDFEEPKAALTANIVK